MSLTKHAHAIGRVASGNHLVAAQDEREPGDLTEADLREIDRAYEAAAVPGGAIDNEQLRRAIQDQQQFLAVTGRLW